MARKKKEEIPTHLSNEDLKGIEDGLNAAQLRLAKIEISKRDIQLLIKQRELLAAEKTIAEHRHGILVEKHKDRGRTHTAFMNELKLRYGIKEGDQFGFDPLTGEVKITRKD